LAVTGLTTAARLSTQAATRMRLGANFNAEQIDPDTGAIAFDSAHHFRNGDPVRYQATNGAQVPGLTEGAPYYVRVLDSSTIQLMATLADALTPPLDVTVADIDPSGLIQTAHNFSDGALVTYQAPSPIVFGSNFVD